VYVTCFATFVANNKSLWVASLKETGYFVGVKLDMGCFCEFGTDREGVQLLVTSDRSRNFVRKIGAIRRGFKLVKVITVEDITEGQHNL